MASCSLAQPFPSPQASRERIFIYQMSTFIIEACPAGHPWRPSCSEGSWTPAAKETQGEGDTSQEAGEKVQPHSWFSLKTKILLCSLCSLPPTLLCSSDSWQPLRATSHHPFPHYQAQQAHTEKHPRALRVISLLPPPQLRPGVGDTQAPITNGSGEKILKV